MCHVLASPFIVYSLEVSGNSEQQIPSEDLHISALTQKAQSLVWSGAGGLAVQQNKINFNYLNCCLIYCLFSKMTVNEGGKSA